MRPRRPNAWDLASPLLLLLLLLFSPDPRPHLSEAALSIPLVLDGTVREFEFAATDDLGARALDIAGRLSLTTGNKCGDGDTPCAFVYLSSLGAISPEKNAETSGALAALLEAELAVPKGRYYINFHDSERSNMGFNGGTF